VIDHGNKAEVLGQQWNDLLLKDAGWPILYGLVFVKGRHTMTVAVKLAVTFTNTRIATVHFHGDSILSIPTKMIRNDPLQIRAMIAVS